MSVIFVFYMQHDFNPLVTALNHQRLFSKGSFYNSQHDPNKLVGLHYSAMTLHISLFIKSQMSGVGVSISDINQPQSPETVTIAASLCVALCLCSLWQK
ncbi:MAG: hypothetical protein ABIX01_17985 [Chitinophagaceae bacterium]